MAKKCRITLFFFSKYIKMLSIAFFCQKKCVILQIIKVIMKNIRFDLCKKLRLPQKLEFVITPN